MHKRSLEISEPHHKKLTDEPEVSAVIIVDNRIDVREACKLVRVQNYLETVLQVK